MQTKFSKLEKYNMNDKIYLFNQDFFFFCITRASNDTHNNHKDDEKRDFYAGMK